MNRAFSAALALSVLIGSSPAAVAQYSLFNETCASVQINSLTEKKPLACRASVSLSTAPDAFSNIDPSALARQDESTTSYSDYDDFQAQLRRFFGTDAAGETKSRDSACQWLYWSNGVMRRPYAGTLCAIAKNSEFIRQTSEKYGVPPEYIACAIGGDSMIVSGQPDSVAREKAGSVRPAPQYILDLVQAQATEKAEADYASRNGGTKPVYVGSSETERLIERIALIGQSAKKKYLGVYGKSDLEFGHGVQREAAILSTIYNKGVDRSNPSASREPIENYFGLSCARLIKITNSI